MKRLHSYDQHFLRSPRVVAELVGHSNIRKNDIVYDLGAGSGVIASVLARRCKRVIAVESEAQALAKLREHLEQVENVTIVQRDILEVVPANEPYKIFANIPFSLSAKVVRKFTEDTHAPKALYFIVQKQFAQKLVPSDQHFTSQLGAQVGARYTARIRKPLRRSDFTPPPAVDTVLLELKLRSEPLVALERLQEYRVFVARCYAEQKFFMNQPRARVNVSPERKPSELSLEQWAQLFMVGTNPNAR